MPSATNIAYRDFQNGSQYVGNNVDGKWVNLSGGSNYITAGYGFSGDKYWTAEIRFTTAKPASSVTVTLETGDQFSGSNKGTILLHYALVDMENTKYNNATEALDGDGTVTMKAQTYAKSTFTVKKEIPEGEHYLYLWAGEKRFTQLYMTSSGSSATTIEYVEKTKIPLYVNVSGSVKQAEAVYVNVNGSIKKAIAVYVNAGGSIKKIQ